MKPFLRRFIRNKRAITPILSELLLTVIAVAAMAVAASATYVITTNMHDNMSERIVIEDVWFNNASQTVNIHLLNTGQIDITTSNVYFNHVRYQTSFHLDIGEDAALTFSPNWTQGETCYIDIVTTRGNHIASYYQAT
jgi:hypothetical protein